MAIELSELRRDRPSGGAIAAVPDPVEAGNGGGAPGNAAAWYVVQTKRHRGMLARTQLEQRGISSYLPLIREWPKPAVGGPIQPMFPGYLFARAVLPHDFARVAFSPGVKGFVVFGSEPASLDDSVIRFLRTREAPDGIIPSCERQENLQLRIVDGPFQGLTAILERRVPARERVFVLLDILQRTTRVELPERCVGLG